MPQEIGAGADACLVVSAVSRSERHECRVTEKLQPRPAARGTTAHYWEASNRLLKKTTVMLSEAKHLLYLTENE